MMFKSGHRSMYRDGMSTKAMMLAALLLSTAFAAQQKPGPRVNANAAISAEFEQRVE